MKKKNGMEMPHLVMGIVAGIVLGISGTMLTLAVKAEAEYICPKETWCFRKLNGAVLRYTKTSDGFPDVYISPEYVKVCAIRKGKECLKYHEAGVDEGKLSQGKWDLIGEDEYTLRFRWGGADCENSDLAHTAGVKDPMGTVKYSCTDEQMSKTRSKRLAKYECSIDANCVEEDND